MRALVVATFCWVLSSSTYAADPLPSVVQEWLRANNTSGEVQREQIIDNVVSVEFVSSTMDGTRLGDRDAFKAYLRGAHGAFKDYRLEVLDNSEHENRIWLRLRASGMHVGPLMGVKPSGTKISLGLVVILEISNDRIIHEWQISDTASLANQLGSSQTGD